MLISLGIAPSMSDLTDRKIHIESTYHMLCFYLYFIGPPTISLLKLFSFLYKARCLPSGLGVVASVFH